MTTPQRLSTEALKKIQVNYDSHYTYDGIAATHIGQLLSHIAAQEEELDISRDRNYNLVKEANRLKQQLEQLQCDHEWKEIDASFDHEFGTEQVFYRECQKCGLTGNSSQFRHGDEEA